MFPLLPAAIPKDLEALSFRVTAAAAALGAGLHPLILREISRLMAMVNSYYTNAIEGNPTRLKEIDAALNKSLSKDPRKRDHQLEHVVHIGVQELMLERLEKEPGLNVCSAEFLCWLHERFYSQLPAELRFARTESGAAVPIVPGQLRSQGVSVGRHEDAPRTRAEIESCLEKFAQFLRPESLSGTERLIGLASSHHRLLWIHPFADGNGRVARLMTLAYARRIGLETNGLWTVARAFARDRARYNAKLDWADQPRRNDLDGRGPLPEENLVDFCGYFLGACEDQLAFMAKSLELQELQGRYRRYIRGLEEDGPLSRSGAELMRRLLPLGEIPRAEVLSILGVGSRRASQVNAELTKLRLVRSETPYGALRLNITAEMSSALFPELA